MPSAPCSALSITLCLHGGIGRALGVSRLNSLWVKKFCWGETGIPTQLTRASHRRDPQHFGCVLLALWGGRMRWGSAPTSHRTPGAPSVSLRNQGWQKPLKSSSPFVSQDELMTCWMLCLWLQWGLNRPIDVLSSFKCGTNLRNVLQCTPWLWTSGLYEWTLLVPRMCLKGGFSVVSKLKAPEHLA